MQRSLSLGGWGEWMPILAGLLVLYVPVFYEFSVGLWQSDDHGHGPIILGLICWLIWRRRSSLTTAGSCPVAGRLAGGVLLLLGLVLYVLGRSQDVTIFEAGALVPILAGVMLTMRGWHGLRALWFPILFVAFLVPLPGTFVDALTNPLKQSVSAIVEQVLYAAGYPIGRTGVLLTIGQYQLLVADACSGLNSMFSLSALGLLYLYIIRRSSLLHNCVVVASILPIAFTANIVRVLVLVLVTYYFGDEAGQGFLHGAAGIVLVVVALALLLTLDGVLAKAIRPLHPT